MTEASAVTPAQRPPHIPRLIPIKDWPKYHAWPPAGGLRWLVFNSAKNGFEGSIRRVGARVLIDEDAFFEWVENQDANAKRGRR